MKARDQLLATLDEEVGAALSMNAPFYATLISRMRDDAAGGGPTWELLEPYAAEPADEFYAFRALAGVHHVVLAGEQPELAGHYPSVGGDGDAEAAWPLVRAVLADHSPELVATIRHPLQTNETARCGTLIGGYLTVARETGLPLRVRALGVSAGLNLHFDRYRYEGGGVAFGPEDSKVRFVDYWLDGIPPLDTPMTVADRRGCDIDPVDPTTEEGRLELLSCMWPDDLPRLEMLRAALDIAAGLPVQVDRESADTWIARELTDLPAGRATVVSHSVFWIYLDQETKDAIAAAIGNASQEATGNRPLAWLRYEVTSDLVSCELRLTLWPGGVERLLAVGGHHLEPVRWLA